MFLLRARTFVSLFAIAIFLMASMGLSSSAFAKDFEVWLVDQSNSNGKTFGGTIHVYDGADLNGEAAASSTPTDVLDLSGATSALCLASTGANPVRPHMLFFNSTHSHAILSFVTSGHVVVFNAATRTPLACMRISPAPVALVKRTRRLPLQMIRTFSYQTRMENCSNVSTPTLPPTRLLWILWRRLIWRPVQLPMDLLVRMLNGGPTTRRLSRW